MKPLRQLLFRTHGYNCGQLNCLEVHLSFAKKDTIEIILHLPLHRKETLFVSVHVQALPW
jgi:hypothetical protein